MDFKMPGQEERGVRFGQDPTAPPPPAEGLGQDFAREFERPATRPATPRIATDFFGSPGRGSGIKDFMNSNSIVARISFLLLAVLIFIVALQIFISILMTLFNKNGSPHLINGMIDARNQMIIPQDPSMSTSRTVTRSVNGPNGVEFTWSVWIFINNITTQPGTYNHVFHKGNNNMGASGINSPNNAPGLYITTTAQNQAELTVVMNTYQTMNEEIDIPNIPLNKWINVIIRCRNTVVDVYINGTMTRSTDILHVPKQNYGDVYVALNNGFDGYISNLWYYNYALGTSAIQTIAKTGPNLKMIDSSSSGALNLQNNKFFSLRWYFSGNQDQFNP